MTTTPLFSSLNQEATQQQILAAQAALAQDSSLQNILAALGPSGGLATQTTLAAVLAKIIAAPATSALQTTANGQQQATGPASVIPGTTLTAGQANVTTSALLVQILNALGGANGLPHADQAALLSAVQTLGTQTTAAAILAKLPSSPALDATVASIHTDLTTGQAHTDSAAIASALAPLGTQTTLAAILAKLVTSPALDSSVQQIHTDILSGQQHTDLGAIVTALGPLATQTTLAAVLAKLSSDPSTGTNQSSEIAALQTIASALGVGSNALTKAEDSAVTSGDRGLATLVMRGLTTPTASTDAPGDYTMPLADSEGKQVVVQGAIPENTWQAVYSPTTATTGALKAAAAAGIRNYLKTLMVTNTAATANLVTVLDGSTVVARVQLAATVGDTKVVNFDPPIRGTAATALNVTTSAAAAIHVTGTGHVGV